MEKTETVVEENGNGRASWINHGLVKAFVTGCVLGVGFIIAGFLSTSFGGHDLNPADDLALSFVLDILVPIITIYLVFRWTNKLLKRFGFEGVMIHQNEKLDFPKLFGAASGCLMVSFLAAMVGTFGTFLMMIGSDHMGTAKFKILIATIIVGVVAFFALARRISHNQAKAQQETQ